jgi:hypothetical protein
MNEEEKEELWRWLRRLDRKVSLIGSLVILIAAWGFAQYAYQEIPDGWGVSKGIAWWAALAIGVGLAVYFGRQFDKE